MKRSKIILSFYVGAIALSAASLSFSVAWYATADKARINSIVMTIDGDRELLISTQKDGDYVQHLNNSDLFDPGTLSPVTTAHSEEWLSLKSDTPKFYDETIVFETKGVPKCSCGGVIKPDVVLYEEGLDSDVINGAVRAISKADCLIIGGTSLVVYPAAGLIDYFNGDKLVLINKSATTRDSMADLVIREPIGQVFSQIEVR